MEAVVTAMIRDRDRIHCGARVRRIEKNGSGWRVSDDQTTRNYDQIVIAFPIHEAIKCFANVPAEVQEAVAGLRYNVVRVAMIAVNNESLMDRSAIYIPDPTVMPHRVCYMGFFSPNMVRPGTSSLIAEITSRPGDEVDRTSQGAVLERVVDDLDRINVIRKGDVTVTDMCRMEYGYPVYDLNYNRNTSIVRGYFASLGIPLLGCFAEFDYINSDECLRVPRSSPAR